MATIEKPAMFAAPGQDDSPVELKDRYDNFIRGEWVAPTEGRYRDKPFVVAGRIIQNLSAFNCRHLGPNTCSASQTK